MTNIQPLAPTDKQLEDFAVEEQFLLFCDADEFTQIARAVLAKWGTPPAVVKWAPEEIADGERGIRWVTNDGIHGRPTDHDVREYLKRTPTAHGCHCDECKQFYTTPQPTQAQAGAVPLTDEQLAEMMRETWGCASIAPRHAIGFARAIEAAHGIGIKGSQHGAKN